VNVNRWIAIALLGLLAAGGFDPLFATDEARQAYDKMVEESVKEADEYVDQVQKEQNEAAEEASAQKDAEMDARVEAERQKIEAQMDAVRNRGLGPTYTQGMKDNQLAQLQEKLDQLDSDPEAYFK
jgi:rhamnose utilization protein RhaD (predicted bifunctional aldolase and dehydrogenase)